MQPFRAVGGPRAVLAFALKPGHHVLADQQDHVDGGHEQEGAEAAGVGEKALVTPRRRLGVVLDPAGSQLGLEVSEPGALLISEAVVQILVVPVVAFDERPADVAFDHVAQLAERDPATNASISNRRGVAPGCTVRVVDATVWPSTWSRACRQHEGGE